MARTRVAASKARKAPGLNGSGAGAPVDSATPSLKQTILEAATEEFSAFGLGGARVDRIAAKAKANKRMLYYYFGNKEDLFLAVLEETYARIRGEEHQLHLAEVDPREAIRRLVHFTWDYYLRHPEFLTLLNSENLHQARHLRKSRKIRTMHSPFVATLGEVLARGRRRGLFRDGVDPVQLYISIAGEGYFYLSNRYTLSRIFDRDLMAPRALAGRARHIQQTILNSVRR